MRRSSSRRLAKYNRWMTTNIGESQEALPGLVAHTHPVDDASTVARAIGHGDIVWLSPGTKLAARGAVWRSTTPTSPERFSQMSAKLRSLFARAEIEDEVDVPGSGPVAFGAFCFDWQDQGSELVVPRVVYGLSDGAAWKTEIQLKPRKGGPDAQDTGHRRQFAAAGPPGRLSQGEQTTFARFAARGGGEDFADWAIKFEAVKRRLQRGLLQKVVLARRVEVRMPSQFNRRSMLEVLAAQFPGCYSFSFGDYIGASPELLVSRLGPLVDSIPLAGSAPRDPDEKADRQLGLDLLASAKNLNEHELTKQAVVTALKPFCSELEAEPKPSLLLLSNVQHLSTKVQGRLGGDADCLQLVAALHPTPAVCGLPANEALQTIREVEGSSRGRYAGPIGWMDHRGDGEWALALRCAELHGASATLFGGAGIVLESDAMDEFTETELKLKAIRSALAASCEPAPRRAL